MEVLDFPRDFTALLQEMNFCPVSLQITAFEFDGHALDISLNPILSACKIFSDGVHHSKLETILLLLFPSM